MQQLRAGGCSRTSRISHDDHHELSEELPMATAQMDASRSTIVIVEDEEAISLFWGDCLREMGFDVQIFSDATGVVDFLDDTAHTGTQIAAAIVDIGLPGLQGDELARQCRDHLPTMPIILATGYDERSYADACAADPLLSILAKPFDTPRLLMRLEQFGVRAPLSH
jgi:DNA-binding response OmpR family regulator